MTDRNYDLPCEITTDGPHTYYRIDSTIPGGGDTLTFPGVEYDDVGAETQIRDYFSAITIRRVTSAYTSNGPNGGPQQICPVPLEFLPDELVTTDTFALGGYGGFFETTYTQDVDDATPSNAGGVLAADVGKDICVDPVSIATFDDGDGIGYELHPVGAGAYAWSEWVSGEQFYSHAPSGTAPPSPIVPEDYAPHPGLLVRFLDKNNFMFLTPYSNDGAFQVVTVIGGVGARVDYPLLGTWPAFNGWTLTAGSWRASTVPFGTRVYRGWTYDGDPGSGSTRYCRLDSPGLGGAVVGGDLIVTRTSPKDFVTNAWELSVYVLRGVVPEVLQAATFHGLVTSLDPVSPLAGGSPTVSGLSYLAASPPEEPEPEPSVAIPAYPVGVSTGAVLGCAENYTVLLQDRRGDATVHVIDTASSVQWRRVLNGVGDAAVTVNTGEGCCGCLAEATEWFHTLTVLRDGARVWGPGPVAGKSTTNDGITVTARDMSGWLGRRPPFQNFTFPAMTDLTTIADTLTRNAMAPDDPYGFRTYVIPTGVKGARSYTRYRGYVLDHLGELVDAGLNWTLSPDLTLWLFGADSLPSLNTLLTEQHVAGAFEVRSDGVDFSTQGAVFGQNGVLGLAGGVDPTYGLIVRWRDDTAITDATSATAAARAYDNDSPPEYVQAPAGVILTPRTPIDVNDLIPGVGVPVSLTVGCRDVTAVLRLAEVSGSMSGGDEKITARFQTARVGHDTTRLPGFLSDIARRLRVLEAR